MTLFEKIEKDYIDAYKAKDAKVTSVLRLLKAAVKNRLVELIRPHGTLNDEEMLDVIIKQAKQREDSIEQYVAAKRQDLADKEREELEILKKYLPAKLSAEELDKVIKESIEKLGAKDPRDMGKVIGHIMSSHKGRVDGKMLSEAVKKHLTAK